METIKKSIIHPMTMTLYSGIDIDIFNIRPEQIYIEDIAHALSNMCRYGGHCLFHYSVAQHSVLCSYEEGTPEEQFDFLMHDSPEYVMSDLIRPIKHRPEFKHYRDAEDKLQKIISKKYNLKFPLSKRTHDVDNQVLIREIRELIIEQSEINLKSREEEISLREARKILRSEKLYNCTIEKISPEEAEELFLNRFYELKEQVKNSKK